VQGNEARWADRIDAIDHMYERDNDRAVVENMALSRMQMDKIDWEYAEYAAEQRLQSLIHRMLI